MAESAPDTLPACDAAAFRRGFPALRTLTYLASCSLGARSVRLSTSLDRMTSLMDAKGAPWEEFEQETEALRDRVGAMVGCDSGQLALLPDMATAAFQAVSSIRRGRETGIVASRAEFPSVAHVWLAQQRRGGTVTFIDAEGSDDEIVALYEAAIGPQTKLVSIPAISYLDGRRLPARRVCDLARDAGCPSFVDFYQAFGAEPVSMDEIGSDYAAAGAMKYLTALPGIAFLYCRADSATGDLPLLTGRRGRRSPLAFNPFVLDWAQSAQRLETGTPAIPSVFAAADAVAEFGRIDLARVRQHIFALISFAFETLAADGETFATSPTREGQAAHITLLDDDPATLAERLAAERVVVSPRGPGVRLSFHLYNNRDDVLALAQALKRCRSASMRKLADIA